MKKAILICMLSMVVAISSAFANKAEGVNDRILNNFKKEFVQARDISWEVNKEFVKATFSLNDQVLYAYYTPTGERIALIRNLRTNQIPMHLVNRLKKSFSDYWVTDLFEIAGSDETAYYVTVENADMKITLKSVGTTDWTTYKKVEKE